MEDQIMLATSKGQSIRVPVEGISFRSRSAGGVRVFNTGTDEHVVRWHGSPTRAMKTIAGR
jgi:DNA gyrase subunit A